jgi:hypothetical protein
MSGLSGLSNHLRERSFLIWEAVGFFVMSVSRSAAGWGPAVDGPTV